MGHADSLESNLDVKKCGSYAASDILAKGANLFLGGAGAIFGGNRSSSELRNRSLSSGN
jgi:hypothetical protein